MLNNIKIALFDIDGTLIDSMQVWEDCLFSFLRNQGVEPPKDFMQEISHLTFNDSAKYVRDRFKINPSEDKIKNDIDELVLYQYSNVIKSKTGIEKFLEFLLSKGIKICILTAGRRCFFEPCLKRLDMNKFFDKIWTAEDFNKNKNDKTLYDDIIKKLNVLPSEVLFFDDNFEALTASKSAGLKTVGIFDYTSRNKKDNIKNLTDYYIDNYENFDFNVL